MSENPGRDRALEEFVQPGPLPEGANLQDAEVRLLGVLEHELGLTLAPPATRRPRGLRSPRLLMFAATLVATAGLLWSVGSLRRKAETPVLRGPVAASEEWDAQPRAKLLGAGKLVLSWSAAPGATGYVVTFLGEDLHVLAHAGSHGATTITVDRDSLPRGLAPGQSVLWRVSAFEGEDELVRSETGPLTLP